MGTIKWTKPNSGVIIETNDLEATVEYAKSLGWTQKRGRKAKADKVEEDMAEAMAEEAADE